MDKEQIKSQIGTLLGRLALLAILWVINSSGCVFIGRRAVNFAVERAIRDNTRQILDQLDDCPEAERERRRIFDRLGVAAACGRPAPFPLSLYLEKEPAQ